MSRCTNPECGVSSDITEDISCGTGRLDDMGFWEFPCRQCEEHFRGMSRPNETPNDCSPAARGETDDTYKVP